MGMVLGFCEISERTRLRILADPPLVWQLVARDAPEVYAEARARANRPGFFARLFGKSGRATDVPALDLESFEGQDHDIDKSWHALHFIFTGTSDDGEMPESFLLTGGEVVGDEDLGYGPGRVLSAREVAEVAAMLDALSDDDLRARYNPERMTALEIYPDIWHADDDPAEGAEYIIENVTLLRTIVNSAAGRGSGLLISLS